MSVKQVHTIEPVGAFRDKRGNVIQVFRGGIVDTNKYAKRSPREKLIRTAWLSPRGGLLTENLGNAKFKFPENKIILNDLLNGPKE